MSSNKNLALVTDDFCKEYETMRKKDFSGIRSCTYVFVFNIKDENIIRQIVY